MDTFNISPEIIEQQPLVSRVKAGDGKDQRADLLALRKACKDFESIFVYTLLKTMRQSLPKSEEARMANDIYASMGDLEVAHFIAHGRGIGLGDLLFDQLKTKPL